jgi:hypothetical protein
MSPEESQAIAERLSSVPDPQLRTSLIALWIEVTYALGKSQGAAESMRDLIRISENEQIKAT